MSSEVLNSSNRPPGGLVSGEVSLIKVVSVFSDVPDDAGGGTGGVLADVEFSIYLGEKRSPKWVRFSMRIAAEKLIDFRQFQKLAMKNCGALPHHDAEKPFDLHAGMYGIGGRVSWHREVDAAIERGRESSVPVSGPAA